MALEKFQRNTVDAAVHALTSGSRRFLIADEVGLGKTISAKAVAQELRAGRNGPLNVVYLCPSLDIASQNLTKLTSLDENWDEPPDRLSLAANLAPSTPATRFRLFSYTPDTSLPGWKAGQRSGKAEERALIASLMPRVAGRFWRRLRHLDHQNSERPDGARHRRQFGLHPRAPKRLVAPFTRALKKVMDLPDGNLDDELRIWLSKRGDDVAEFVLRARAALALVALSSPMTRPHLLILDEFHRYADLILPEDRAVETGLRAERLAVQRLLVETMLGGDGGLERPALLLMSATPYRLLRVDGTQVETSRYRGFIRLVRFLFGQEDEAAADDAEARIAAHHRALQATGDRDANLKAVLSAKTAVETALRPIIVRTERATTIHDELFDRRSHPAQVEPDDLRVFRHFASAVATAMPAMKSWVTPLWSSVPYPAETLFDYKVSGILKDLPEATSAARVGKAAHPQMRALVGPDDPRPAPVDLSLLGLPWVVPTAPWWQLGGRWAELSSERYPVGKALLFSRYVGAPLAVSALLSLDLHRRQRAAKTVQPYLRYEAKTPWPLISFFLPWPNLSTAVEPARCPDRAIGEVVSLARRSLAVWLKAKKFRIKPRTGAARKPWQLAFEVETALGAADPIVEALKKVSGLPHATRRSWLKHRPQRSLSRQEVNRLADWLLASPGAVIGRSLARHQPGLLATDEGLADAFGFCWNALRPYFGQRAFAPAILPRRRGRARVAYAAALRRAILAGGFEAVLDEHLAVMDLIGDDTPLGHLKQSIMGRAGRVRLRKNRVRKPARISVHAAVPYAGAERRKSGRSKDGKLRSDSLRRAFNSPFWPHVLATTSVGQEGLDFHVWCDRIVHWDLPRDPVDFEQREGRVARYASLCVRRSLARNFAEAGLNAPGGTSPFAAIFDAARSAKKEGIGLERWWSPPAHKPVSITFDLRFSQNATRLKTLQDDLTRYRLALGQPEPSLFEDMVKHFDLPPGKAREFALDLSARDVGDPPSFP